jgi:glycosyltransferase involved in cell wall biosynthesis
VDVTIVVPATDDVWLRLARQRAIPSAQALGVPVVEGVGPTVMDARNDGLAQVTTEWVVHLDADDELEPGYLDAMAAGTADVRAPAVRYMLPGGRPGTDVGPAMPRVAGHTHACEASCLPYGNWLVVGAAVRTDLVRRVGGWRGYEWSEDWDLWLRCHLAGATIEPVPAAVYRAHVRWRSRNRAISPAKRLAVHRQIAAANGVPIP